METCSEAGHFRQNWREYGRQRVFMPDFCNVGALVSLTLDADRARPRHLLMNASLRDGAPTGRGSPDGSVPRSSGVWSAAPFGDIRLGFGHGPAGGVTTHADKSEGSFWANYFRMSSDSRCLNLRLLLTLRCVASPTIVRRKATSNLNSGEPETRSAGRRLKR